MNTNPGPLSSLSLDPARLPRHVAIIMDGNGRWATKRSLSRLKGHWQGAESVRAVVRVCRELGIPALTLFAFSTENWGRPAGEVSGLMKLLSSFLASELEELKVKGIRLSTIGQIERLPQEVRKALAETKAATAQGQRMVLNLALSYGSRAEILRAAQNIAADCLAGRLKPEDLDEEKFGRYLFTADLPEVDLVIRTSGEMRLSNFLLWQAAYAELHFSPVLWPDFREAEFKAVLADYQSRERRYGLVSAEQY